MKYEISITDKYSSHSGNIEYWLCDKEGEIEWDLNIQILIKKTEHIHIGVLDFWFECYESEEAHDNGQELLRLYNSKTFDKATRERIRMLEAYFLYGDIE
jgi:hypothetical protein